MERVFTLLLLFFVSFGFSQSPALEPGVYKANVQGQKLMLKVLEDNNYEMAIFFGKYTVENDTVTFNNSTPKESVFSIKPDKDAEFSSTLKIKITPQMLYMGRGIYIGTQKDEHSVVEYKPLSDYVEKRVNSHSMPKDVKIDVEKAKYLYLVDSQRDGNTSISKFELDPNINQIEVGYSGSSFKNVELKGIIDRETKKISVSEGRTKAVIFEFEKDNGVEQIKKDEVSPLAVLSEKDWLKKNGFATDEDFDSSYLEQRAKTKYTFKYANYKTYPEALKSLEKLPEKFLIIVVNNSKNSKTEFARFIKEREERMSRYMRNGYDAEIDNFNFYLATEKDKALIDNFKIKSKTALAFVNSNGVLLYHTDGTLEDNSNFFQRYYSVYDEVNRANEHFKLDKLVTNKKASLSDFKKAFATIIKTKKRFNDFSQETLYDDEVVEVVDTTAVAVDTAAAVYEGDDYFQVKDPENLYSTKTNKEIIAGKWQSIIDFYTKSNTYDEEFVQLCKKELLNRGFLFKLYGGQKMVDETDFKILDYVFKNYNDILKNDKKQYLTNEEDYLVPASPDRIDNVLSNFFQNRTTESANLHRSNQVKLIGYYKTFLKFSGYHLADFRIYLERVKESNKNDSSLYFKEFSDFFQVVDSKNTSLIETLDEMFEDQKSSYMNWLDFKRSFAELANNIAWEIVETKSTDKNTIQKAIRWSEASLKAEKNEHNCLDTLAQLYYMNNEKDRAIATEQKAIDAVKSTDEKRAKEYTDILGKMKNGNY